MFFDELQSKVLQNNERSLMQNNETNRVQNNERSLMQNNETNRVQNNERMLMQNYETNRVQNNERMLMQNNESIPVQNNEPIPEQSNESIPVQSNESIPVQSNESNPVQSNESIPVQSNEPIPVQSNDSIPVQSNEPIPEQNTIKQSPVEQNKEQVRQEQTSSESPTHHESNKINTDVTIPKEKSIQLLKDKLLKHEKEKFIQSIQAFLEREHEVDVTIFPQGSYAIGLQTEKSDYDQMFQIEFKSKQDNLQESIKKIFFSVGDFVQKYRNDFSVEQKNRCWNVLTKQDDIDIVLGFRTKDMTKNIIYLFNSEENHGGSKGELRTSNPIGYQEWFLRIANHKQFKNTRKVQNLVLKAKHHRDNMYEHHALKSYKPISVIITTLLGKYAEDYLREPKLKSTSTLQQYALNRLQKEYIQITHVRNPICMKEDFTDKWMHNDGGVRKNEFRNWAEVFIKKNI